MKKIWLILIILLVGLLALFFIIRGPVAKKQNEKGRVAFRSADYLQAEKHFSNALAWKGKYSDAHINLIKCLLEQDKTEAAGIRLEKLIENFPDLAESFALKGQIRVVEGEYEQALESLNTALKKDSLLSYAWFYRGVAHANLGNLDQAASDYLQAQQIDQTNTEALEAGARIFSKLEDFESAIQNYNLILEMDPSNTRAYLERAGFKLKIGDLDNAISDYNKVIGIDASIADAYYNRGLCHARKEEYEKAIQDFTASAEMNHKVAGAHLNAGLAYLKLNDAGKAERELTKSIEADTEKEHLYKSLHIMGVICMQKQEHDKALDYFNKSIEANDSFADAYYNRGIALGLLERYQEALEDLTKSLELGKKSADVYFAMGIQKINLGYTAEGCNDLATAEKMGHEQAALMRNTYCKNYMK